MMRDLITRTARTGTPTERGHIVNRPPVPLP
jgi:hypothetical protein